VNGPALEKQQKQQQQLQQQAPGTVDHSDKKEREETLTTPRFQGAIKPQVLSRVKHSAFTRTY
jgi:hypothetical protein